MCDGCGELHQAFACIAPRSDTPRVTLSIARTTLWDNINPLATKRTKVSPLTEISILF